MTLRNEKKIVLTREQYFVLSTRMRGLLQADPHMPSPDGYFIASLYFDDQYETAYYEKLSGKDYRRKYRVRLYNGDTSFIRLECKEKYGDKIGKRSEPIGLKTYEGLTRGDFRALSEETGPLAREVYALTQAKGLAPKVAVTYRREAYLHPLSTTRITFDKELRAGWGSAALLSQEAESFAAFPAPDYPYDNAVILEIKYDEYLPRFVADALQTGGQLLAASKYVLCRDRLFTFGKPYTK
ncbi:MAG: polyphosphate polymerase domain-containing protein [Lachnospiraceae bacterium]|nr:polyphosphate polymerase domain-containing protein [Lachnospiraceae bacterium]